jgi:CrcB protein
MIYRYLLIFLGCGIGGLFRYWISNGIYLLWGQRFPYGTLVVNVTGSLLMGLLFIFISDRFYSLAPQLRAFLLIGLLGGYTTFSSFSMETVQLLLQGDMFKLILNIALNVILCITAAWVGVIIGRQL